jgi:hypothetical protein
MFAVFSNGYQQGFHIKFDNGWTVSVQFGRGNYCENRDDDFTKNTCNNAEIAAWDKDNEWYRFDDNDVVKGWCKPDVVAAFIQLIASK